MKNSTLKQQYSKVNILSSVANRTQVNILYSVIEVVQCAIHHMEKRYTQLRQISENHFDVYLRMQAEDYSVLQLKLLAFANEFFDRATKFLEALKSEKKSEAAVQRYVEELEVLNFMDYKVTKQYGSFIHDNFDALVIQMPIAV